MRKNAREKERERAERMKEKMGKKSV